MAEPRGAERAPEPEHRGAKIYPLRDFGHVRCYGTVDLVIHGFTSFSRLTAIRHRLLGIADVRWARITGYVGETAFMSAGVAPGTPSSALVPDGARLVSSDGERVEFTVDA